MSDKKGGKIESFFLVFDLVDDPRMKMIIAILSWTGLAVVFALDTILKVFDPPLEWYIYGYVVAGLVKETKSAKEEMHEIRENNKKLRSKKKENKTDEH